MVRKRHPVYLDYKVSDQGKVWSCRSGTWKRMKGTVAKRKNRSYVIVELFDGRRAGIHQLVLETFVGPCPPGLYARHLNGVPTDNRLENLKWGTPTKNNRDKIRHGTITRGTKVNTAVLNPRKVRKIRRMRKTGRYTLAELGAMFKVTPTAIHLIIKRKNWAWVK